jgi:hypothetical protein
MGVELLPVALSEAPAIEMSSTKITPAEKGERFSDSWGGRGRAGNKQPTWTQGGWPVDSLAELVKVAFDGSLHLVDPRFARE